ncbi:hypothetical protein AB0B83_26770 [Micromonospora sp. NPDC049060]|uniref:hypothetical protein n=1 Tax=Micromonospora sp. NPDC049060 TaxID=3154828 RepID=UPI0033C96408
MRRNAAKSVRPPAMRQVERRARHPERSANRSAGRGPVATRRTQDGAVSADSAGAGADSRPVPSASPPASRGPVGGGGAAAAGLDRLRLHDLRHACATFLLVCCASPRTVKVLGHSQIGPTMNTYAHVLLEIERAAVDEAAKHLFG